MELWKRYKAGEGHIHINKNKEEAIFEDALAMQGNRIIANVMTYLKVDREEAFRIAFWDIVKTREVEE